ncbi:hypothetical protein AHAS_Ahas15G0249000 [Arachis hypogaea]
MRAKIDGHMTEVDFSSESESEEDSEEPRRKQPKRMAKKMESRKRKHILEDSSSKTKSESNDELSKEEESVSDPAQQQMVIFQPPSESLNIVPIQLCLPSSQTTSATPVPPFELSPQQRDSILHTYGIFVAIIQPWLHLFKPRRNIEPRGQWQPEPQVGKSLETTVLIKELDELVEKIAKGGVKTPLDSTKGKSPPIEKQTVGQIFDKFETPARSNLMSAKMKEKCYLWATRIRTYGDGTTDEYDPICTLNTQQPLLLSRVHFASLKATSYIEAVIRLE